MPTTWVDSHCHLQERYLPDHDEHDAAEALRRAAQAGVSAVVCVGTDEATSRQAMALSGAVRAGALGGGLPAVRSVVGLHPHEATASLAWLDGLVGDRPDDLVGIGECGLDYFYEHAPKAAQRQAFAAQIALAQVTGLALVIHARDAWEDLFDVLESEGVPTETVLHCFTGGPAEAERCVALGLTVSFSGIVTFKNAQDIREAAARVPLDAGTAISRRCRCHLGQRSAHLPSVVSSPGLAACGAERPLTCENVVESTPEQGIRARNLL